MNKPITPKLLADPSNDFVKKIVYIYSMETFIFKELNAASRNKDESKLKFYGPLAAALSFIVHCGNSQHTELKAKKEFFVYRGLQLSTQELEQRYQIDKRFRLKGFTSTTLNRSVAVDFAVSNLTLTT